MTYIRCADLMKVTVPEGDLDGLKVEHFEVEDRSMQNLFLGDRLCEPGEYTRLILDGELWMSDTTAERTDHLGPVMMMRDLKAKRLIINGLGLGMIVAAALSLDHVEHIDVVEIDERVCALIGPHYTKDPRVNLICGDAFEQMTRWPSGTTWDIGWTDIWPTISSRNLPEMARFNRSYGRRCVYHGCWAQDIALQQRDIENRWIA